MLIGNYDQRIFDLYFGLTSQSVVYAASGDDTASGMSSVDSIWIDGTLYVRGGDAGPFPNSTWQAMERPDVTDGDEIYFRGTVSDTTGNGGPQSGLFIGPSFTPIYLTGEMYPNLPDPLSSTALDFNYQLSPDGTHNIAELDLEATIFDDSAIAIDGSGLVLGGTLVREGNIIPSSIGGIGDGRGRRDRRTRAVVDDLHRDVFVRAEHRHARALCGAVHLAANAVVAAMTSLAA